LEIGHTIATITTSVAWEPTPNIHNFQVWHSKAFRCLENSIGVIKSSRIGRRIAATRANMKGNASNKKAEFLGNLEQLWSLFNGATKFL